MPQNKEENIHGILTTRIDYGEHIIVPAEGGYRTVRAKTPGMLFKRIGHEVESMFIPYNVLRAALLRFEEMSKELVDADAEAREAGTNKFIMQGVEIRHLMEAVPEHIHIYATEDCLKIVSPDRILNVFDKTHAANIAANPILQIAEMLGACVETAIVRYKSEADADAVWWCTYCVFAKPLDTEQVTFLNDVIATTRDISSKDMKRRITDCEQWWPQTKAAQPIKDNPLSILALVPPDIDIKVSATGIVARRPNTKGSKDPYAGTNGVLLTNAFTTIAATVKREIAAPRHASNEGRFWVVTTTFDTLLSAAEIFALQNAINANRSNVAVASKTATVHNVTTTTVTTKPVLAIDQAKVFLGRIDPDIEIYATRRHLFADKARTMKNLTDRIEFSAEEADRIHKLFIALASYVDREIVSINESSFDGLPETGGRRIEGEFNQSISGTVANMLTDGVLYAREEIKEAIKLARHKAQGEQANSPRKNQPKDPKPPARKKK